MMTIPGRDVLREARARFHPVPYLSDWTSGLALGAGILAPAAHVFFLSLFPALAFSAQMEAGTGGAVAGVQVLMSTAIFGLVQAVLGAESLLIVGVAEPLVLIYTFLYRFAIEQSPTLLATSAGSGYSPAELFLPWVGYVCVFSGIGCVLLACLGAASYTASFSRFAGESFGAVVAALFFQQAVKISTAQFRLDALYSEAAIAEMERSSTSSSVDSRAIASLYALANGVFSLLVACGLVSTALVLRRARAASVGTPRLRGLVADYGTVIATVVWTGLSFATTGFSPTTTTTSSSSSPRIPARLAAVENAWESVAFWATAARMRAVPAKAVAAALLPAAVVIVLFFFDHGISALMARDVLRDRGGGGEKDEAAAATAEETARAAADEGEEGALEAGGRAAKAATAESGAAVSPGKAPPTNKLKPSAYAYDLFLCGLSMVAAGVMGLPPTNGVLPQAPMHTHALSVAAGERAMRIAAAAEVEEQEAEAEAEAAAAGATVAAENGGFLGLQRRRPPLAASRKKKKAPSAAAEASDATTTTALPPPASLHHQPLEPLETRVASLLQYLAILACAFAGPLLRQIPRGAIAGYFAFMALEWVGDSEMVDRLRWLCSDAAGRARVRRPVAAFAAAVPASPETALPLPAPPPPPPPPPPAARWTRAPTKSIAAFTAFQLVCVVLVYALTWVPVAGILFPVPIMLFVPLRTHLLPRVFGRAQIELLDGP